jgi:hypothetical protein
MLAVVECQEMRCGVWVCHCLVDPEREVSQVCQEEVARYYVPVLRHTGGGQAGLAALLRFLSPGRPAAAGPPPIEALRQYEYAMRQDEAEVVRATVGAPSCFPSSLLLSSTRVLVLRTRSF